MPRIGQGRAGSHNAPPAKPFPHYDPHRCQPDSPVKHQPAVKHDPTRKDGKGK